MAREKQPMHELFVRGLFEEACAHEGLTGDRISEAAETFIQMALDRGVEIKFPRNTHLAIGVTGRSGPA